MANFERRDDHELARLADEALLAYIAAAREAGAGREVERALAIMVNRYERDVRYRVWLKIPEADRDDVVQICFMSAIFSSIEGRSVGEFRKWLNRIVNRRIADYHRKPGLDTGPLAEEHSDDEEVWGDVPATQDETEAVEARELVERVLATRSAPHVLVIDLFVFDSYSAKETAEMVNGRFEDLDPPMKVDNVSQIARRFREDLREALEESDNPD